MPGIDLKIVLLVFGVIFLVVLLTRKAAKKVYADRAAQGKIAKKPLETGKPKLTEEQFHKSWKALSYILILAALGNLYMVFTGVRDALTVPAGAAIFWLDAVFSFAAAVAAVMVWRTKRKLWVFVYFGFTILPIIMFMSIKGAKLNALIHLFPLVLLYFVLQPVWDNMET